MKYPLDMIVVIEHERMDNVITLHCMCLYCCWSNLPIIYIVMAYRRYIINLLLTLSG